MAILQTKSTALPAALRDIIKNVSSLLDFFRVKRQELLSGVNFSSELQKGSQTLISNEKKTFFADKIGEKHFFLKIKNNHLLKNPHRNSIFFLLLSAKWL